MPPSDGTYTVEVGRELEVTCAVNPGDIEPVLPDSERSQSQLSVVAFRVDAGEPELTSTYAHKSFSLISSPTCSFWSMYIRT